MSCVTVTIMCHNSYCAYIQYVPVPGESSDPKGTRHQQDREHDGGVITEGRDGQMGRKGNHMFDARCYR